MWRFTKMLPGYVWDAAVLEGNPFTYPEVQTLLEGITVGGRKLSDERQILNLSESANELIRLVRSGQFQIDKSTSDLLNGLIASGEALEAGHFWGEGSVITQVSVNMGAHGTHRPPPTEPGGENLRRIFQRGTDVIMGLNSSVFEQAVGYWRKDGTRMFRFLASCWKDAQ